MRYAARKGVVLAGLFGLSVLAPAARAADILPVPAQAPAYFGPAFRSALMAPLPAVPGRKVPSAITPGAAQVVPGLAALPATIPADGTAANSFGSIGFRSGAGAVSTDPQTGNAFFRSLGSNGRSCGTCHLPSQGMSFSVADAKRRFQLDGVKDPLFAPVDGANCPNQVPQSETQPSGLFGSPLGSGLDSTQARSMLLNHGLLRVFLPVPAGADFTLSITPQDDPYTCNTDPVFARDPANPNTRIVSVYRRPMISANLIFATKSGGNIMWDGREPSLASQALSATLGHAQRDTRPPPVGQGPLTQNDPVIREIVAFETDFFSAQQVATKAGALTDGGAKGGVQNLQAAIAKGVRRNSRPTFDEYDAWARPSGTPSTIAARKSIQRGQDLFTGKNPRGRFSVANVPGFSDFPGVRNPEPNQSCAICHNARHGGSDLVPNSQMNIGTTGDTAKGQPLRKDLPVFTITCTRRDNRFLGRSFKTNDPGLALISGKCADSGKMTVPQMRALVAHAPFFHDGSAATLLDVVQFYDKRFAIGMTNQDRQDLVNFLSAL